MDILKNTWMKLELKSNSLGALTRLNWRTIRMAISSRSWPKKCSEAIPASLCQHTSTSVLDQTILLMELEWMPSCKSSMMQYPLYQLKKSRDKRFSKERPLESCSRWTNTMSTLLELSSLTLTPSSRRWDWRKQRITRLTWWPMGTSWTWSAPETDGSTKVRYHIHHAMKASTGMSSELSIPSSRSMWTSSKGSWGPMGAINLQKPVTGE